VKVRLTKQTILMIKIAIFVGVVAFVARFVWLAWQNWNKQVAAANQANMQVSLATIDWRYGIVAVLGFIGVMLVSGLTWRWLAWRMGDRSPTVRAVGAYIFSQMFKYVPGKVALLLARIDRAGRFGMTGEICTLSTLLENALYMVSGALVGMFAVTHIAAALPAGLPHRALLVAAMWPVTIAAVVVLAGACHPRVFYTLVNALLKKMKMAPVPREERLGTGTLAAGVLMFVPCWACGALALWGSTCCLLAIPIGDCAWFIGAFSLSVIIGMLSFLPGGAVIREVVLGTAVTLQLQASGVPEAQAVLLGTLVAILQRVFQLAAELILLVVGAVLTRKNAPGAGGGIESLVAPDGAAVDG
jgi:hypothetical protein